MRRPFYRNGPPVRVPVSASSAAMPYSMTGKIPENAKSFMFVNPNPFDVRLEGNDTVTASTGWLIMARTVMGPFTTKMPSSLSAQAFATPGNPLPSGFDYTGCVIELIYGEGD